MSERVFPAWQHVVLKGVSVGALRSEVPVPIGAGGPGRSTFLYCVRLPGQLQPGTLVDRPPETVFCAEAASPILRSSLDRFRDAVQVMA